MKIKTDRDMKIIDHIRQKLKIFPYMFFRYAFKQIVTYSRYQTLSSWCSHHRVALSRTFEIRETNKNNISVQYIIQIYKYR